MDQGKKTTPGVWFRNKMDAKKNYCKGLLLAKKEKENMVKKPLPITGKKSTHVFPGPRRGHGEFSSAEKEGVKKGGRGENLSRGL